MTSNKIYTILIVSILHLTVCVKGSTVSFSVASPTCQNEQIKFTNTSTWGDRYLWRFGDGATSTAENPDHTYTISGTYNVTLIVTQSALSDSLTQTITIYTTQYKDLKYEDNISCNPTLLWDTSETTLSRLWDFGDGTTSTDSFVSHLYNDSGYYTINLTAETKYGCTRKGTFDSLVYSKPRPTADFSIDPTNPTSYDSIIYFVEKSEGDKNSSWYWQLGDGDISNEREPVHEYDSSGEYRVLMVVRNDYGCTDTVIHTFFISEMSSWYIPTTFTPNGDMLNDVFLPITHNMEAKEFEFYVYDKWGKLAFQSHDVNLPWNGCSFRNQELLPSGVYTWQMKIVYESGFEVKKTGFVNLLAVDVIAR